MQNQWKAFQWYVVAQKLVCLFITIVEYCNGYFLFAVLVSHILLIIILLNNNINSCLDLRSCDAKFVEMSQTFGHISLKGTLFACIVCVCVCVDVLFLSR